MFLLAPSCCALQRALIANAMSAACSLKNEDNVIADFSVVGTEAFWSLYKGGVKYAEDLLPMLSGVNPKMLKSFLSAGGSSLVLGLKNKKLSELDSDGVLYLAQALSNCYKRVFIILPSETSDVIFNLAKNSANIVIPFLSDAVSIKNAISVSDLFLSKASSVNIIPLKLELGYDFHTDKILKDYELFKNAKTADFNAAFQEQILSPKYSYRDKSNSFVKAAMEITDAAKSPPSAAADIGGYFQKESVYAQLRDKIHGELVDKMKDFVDETDAEKLKNAARTKIEEILKKLDLNLPSNIARRLYKELCDDVAGLGVLEDFLSDEAVTEIMVNGPDMIYIEKEGLLTLTGAAFPDEKRLKTVIDRIVSQIGRHIDEASPIVDARLKDGSRVNAVIKPIALNGAALTIRKFLKNKLSADQLVSSGSISKEMTEFLKTAVILKKNIIISGGTGTGKTTLLNAVSSFIPEKERLVTIEDSAELQLQQKHVVRLESRPKSSEGTGEISIRRLVVNALRMRPDRIIVGECRSGEALDMLQAMATGHEGSMSTVHANSAQDAVSRLATMVLMSGVDLPERSIISQIASAVNVIVQVTRYSDGSRRISSISVLNQTGGDRIYEVKKVFGYELRGFENGKQKGEFKASGFIPDFIKTAANSGVTIDLKIFNAIE